MAALFLKTNNAFILLLKPQDLKKEKVQEKTFRAFFLMISDPQEFSKDFVDWSLIPIKHKIDFDWFTSNYHVAVVMRLYKALRLEGSMFT